MIDDSGSRSRKEQITRGFDAAAEEYDEHASLQRDIAKRLIASLEPWRDIIPSGPIIELGCGTGFVTKGLLDLYPKRQIEAIDLSNSMIERCRRKFPDKDNLSFQVADAEQPSHTEPHYALSIAGYMAHWLKDPARSLAQWLEATQPGGLLLASFPANESFPEWKRHCRELGLPFTGNSLPDVEEMVVKMSVGPSQVDYYEDTVKQTFNSALDFFQQLRQVGASTQLEGRSLSKRERTLLIDHWDQSTTGAVTVSYHIVFLAVKRNYDS